MTLPRELLETDVAPNHLPDTDWLDQYLARGEAREPIMLGLGERWGGTPAPLLAALGSASAASHGYQLSMYGLPRLRGVLRDYLRRTHRLEGLDDAYEVAVGWTGTRAVMRDYAELLAARHSGRKGHLSALVVAPSWDYAGILEPSGFRIHYLDPTLTGSWEPTPEMIADTAAGLTGGLDLVVINAQHNPTGISWSPDTVRALVRLAAEHGAAVLVDDAYYGFLDPAGEPTSALLELLTEESAAGLPWLAVRSLGKQFNCNGWAVGAVTGPPGLLDELVNDVRARHTYNHGAFLQNAMADWLTDERAVSEFLAREREEYEEQRTAAVTALTRFGVSRIVAGPAGPYLLYPMPENRDGDRMAYLEDCAVRAGVLMSDAWPAARLLAPRAGRHVRMYLGRPPEVLTEACVRLSDAGLLG
ncbi:pyridoxal phosphate-dependent aminotransferase [Streptomyces sp. NPDC059814]|uniref:pyridoxal phosphate-dependent aminotransferase n=1 Tax=Streptomyces sp. NPDC059814 TaxID=3346959 RepID=UPI003646D8C6